MRIFICNDLPGLKQNLLSIILGKTHKNIFFFLDRLIFGIDSVFVISLRLWHYTFECYMCGIPNYQSVIHVKILGNIFIKNCEE